MKVRIFMAAVLGMILALALPSPSVTRDASRGVLAANTTQAVYRTGDAPRIEIGLVDRKGRTVCGADVRVRVRRDIPRPVLALSRSGISAAFAYLSAPLGEKTLTLKTISSETCREERPQKPDYRVDVPVTAPGRYTYEVVARSAKGVFFAREHFLVEDKPAFEVKRRADTRIYPDGAQEVVIELNAPKAFRGIVVERVPDAFEVHASLQGARFAGVLRDRKNGMKRIVWKLSLKAGERITLGYRYDVTAISPRYYEIGPLALIEGRSKTILREGRSWQVASDVNSGVIVAWPSTAASIPAGWNRVTALDTYFLEGTIADPSAVAGGNATHTHTSPGHQHTLGNHTHTGTTNAPATGIGTGAGTLGANYTHTHTTTIAGNTDLNVAASANLGATSNDPPYTEVIWIKSDGTNDIPSGAWAFFNSDTLPASWTRKSGNRFLKGAAAAGNGGGTGGSSNSHTHTDSGHTHTENSHTHTVTVNPDTGANGAQRGGTADQADGGHTHVASGGGTTATEQSGTGTLATADGQPLFTKLNIIQNDTGIYSLPSNIIAMWDGTTASIPSGWVLCNGVGSCQDLDNRFIKGANADAETGTTGGASNHVHDSSGTAHSHTINAHSHSFTIAQTTTNHRQSGSGVFSAQFDHTHTLTSSSVSVATGTTLISANANTDNRPPYKEICYIQYVGRRIYFISLLDGLGRWGSTVWQAASSTLVLARIELHQNVLLVVMLSLLGAFRMLKPPHSPGVKRLGQSHS